MNFLIYFFFFIKNEKIQKYYIYKKRILDINENPFKEKQAFKA